MNVMKKIIAVGMALLMFCSLLTVVSPSAYALAGAYKKGEGKIYAWGCDMSKWNVAGNSVDLSLVDFAKMKADGCDFVILRIGDEKAVNEGVRQPDPAFVPLYNKARAAGMHVGAYYYSYRTTSAGVLGDVQFCLDIIEKNNMYFEYPIYFDIEADVHYNLSASKQVELCNTWCDAMVENGYFPGVYSNMNCALDNLQASSNFNYDTWVPKPLTPKNSGEQYKPAETTTYYIKNVGTVNFSTNYGMWQYKWYSDSWSEPSYDGSYWYDSKTGWPLDCNVAFRDYPTIMQTYGYNNMAIKHTITFESNGGSAVEDVKVKDGDTLTAPTNPIRLGFDFAGWYCNPELTDPYDFSTPVPYGFTLYAKWTEANWDPQLNLMPNSAQLQLNDFSGQGAIWPYWNADEYNSVTMYNGVTNDSNWSWPSAYMAYENCFDAVNNGILYVKKDGDAQFNVTLTYLDKDGVSRELNLSDVANIGKTDFPAGKLEEYYDVGTYIRGLGHAPDSGNVKFTKVTYFCIGAKDSYVTLYDLKFVPKSAVTDPYQTFMTHNITQLSGAGNYSYNDGTLTMNAVSSKGYSVKMNRNQAFDPTELVNLLMDVESTVPFNVTFELTGGNGDATMELKNEFFNVFDMTYGEEALPAGSWNVVMNLLGYYEWNGGAVDASVIKSVTVTMMGEGTLTLRGLQASRRETIEYVSDGMTASGALEEVKKGDVDGNSAVTTADVRLILLNILGVESFSAEQEALADYNGDGVISTTDARAILIALAD